MKSKIILELNLAVERKISQKEVLTKYQFQYNKSKYAYSVLCKICKEWQLLDLPYDCLSGPDYCVKDRNDFAIISLYEELLEIFLDAN